MPPLHELDFVGALSSGGCASAGNALNFKQRGMPPAVRIRGGAAAVSGVGH